MGFGFRVQRSGSSSFMVKLDLRLRYNTHPPREAHNIEDAKHGLILKMKRPYSESKAALF